jgi:hypothetical protein
MKTNFPLHSCTGDLAFAGNITDTRQNAATGQGAFTRSDLCVVLSVLTLLALVVLPALANTRPRSARVICANNLRQIGMGLQLWGNDFNDQPPWEVPARLPGAGGFGGGPGTMQHSLAPNVWLHLAWISNEVATPKIYLCPSDSGRPASDFTGNAPDGYLHPNFRNAATSYFLSHAFYNTPTAMIAGDRNVGSDFPGGCSRFNYTLGSTLLPQSSAFQWNTNLHHNAGNLLRGDGRVEQFSNLGLRNTVTTLPIGDGGSLHYITPR